jgi:transposase-like protein
MRRRYTGKQRAALLDLVRSGAATAADAADRLGVTRSTAYYWVRGAASGSRARARRAPVAKAALPSKATFVRVVPSAAVTAGIALRVGAAEIQVQRGFDPEVLRAVVEALGGEA